MRRRVVAALAAFLVSFAVPDSSGAPRYRYVPNDYASIQSAIDACAKGDIVLVADGTYRESIDFGGKEISVLSVYGRGATTIDAQGDGSVVTFDDGEGRRSVLDGFTITGGSNSGYGGGITCKQSSPTIRRCRVTGNWGKAGGIYTEDGSPRVEACELLDNTAREHGGGFSAKYGGEPVLENCLIAGNYADALGGGIHAYESVTAVFVGNCTIADNEAGEAGGGVSSESYAELYLANCILWGDRGPSGPEEIAADDDPEDVVFVAFCDVEGGYGSGSANFSEPPLFVDAGDYHLAAASPCIDMGTAHYSGFVAPAEDFDGDVRPNPGGYHDVGYDEFMPPFPTPALRTCDVAGEGKTLFVHGDTVRFEVSFEVPAGAAAKYQVSVKGKAKGVRFVKRLARSRKLAPGAYTWTWDAKVGKRAAPGTVDVQVKYTVRRVGSADDACTFQIE